MSGCPACGSDRLKRASPAVIPTLSRAGKRRYVCIECGWTGWKHRLQPRSTAGTMPRQRRRRDAKAIVFGIGIVVFLIAIAIVLYENLGRDGPNVVEVNGPSGRAGVACIPLG